MFLCHVSETRLLKGEFEITHHSFTHQFRSIKINTKVFREKKAGLVAQSLPTLQLKAQNKRHA